MHVPNKQLWLGEQSGGGLLHGTSFMPHEGHGHPSCTNGSHGGSTSSNVVSWESGYNYGNMGCRIFKRGIQNKKDCWAKINILKGSYWNLTIDIVASCQKLGIISENIEVIKNTFYKKCAAKLILLNEKKNQKKLRWLLS